MLIIDSIFLLPDVIALNYISMFMLIRPGNVCLLCHLSWSNNITSHVHGCVSSPIQSSII